MKHKKHRSFRDDADLPPLDNAGNSAQLGGREMKAFIRGLFWGCLVMGVLIAYGYYLQHPPIEHSPAPVFAPHRPFREEVK